MRIFGTILAIAIVVIVGWSLLQSPDDAPPASVAEEAETALPAIGMVDDARILDAVANEPGSWMAHGIDFNERRFSPLTQINRDNIGELGLAWSKDLNTFLAQEATPLMVDGLLIFPSEWNTVYAVDAVTGEQRWMFDPKVDRKRHARIWTPISRGVAVYQGRVIVATVDGWLVSVDAATGKEVWRVDTFVNRDISYFISGAPRVGGGKIYVGNGGSEWGTRGYTTAYDAQTGEQAWRFWSVPGDPSQPFEHPEMEMAAATWKGGEWWKVGGGGNVWNSIVYDAELNQVYLGMGNAAPWVRVLRSPGGGDNLFAASIVAVNADTGVMNWYYQQVPGDNWDFTTVQDMALVDLEIDGEMRKVIWQAPKNGFFYVVDRTNGELLRAHPFGSVTWASHVDLETGRPVEVEGGQYWDEAKWVWPGPLGAHNWQAMSVDVDAGVVYMGTHDWPYFFKVDPAFKETGIYKYSGGPGANTGMDENLAEITEVMEGNPDSFGYIGAFDPMTGEYKWKNEKKHFWNGGVVATAGGLVFQGGGDGHLTAYDKDNGEEVWTYDTYTSIVAPPISYQIDGTQYVAIITGAAGVEAFLGESTLRTATNTYGNRSQLLVFALGGSAVLAEPEARPMMPPEQPLLIANAQGLKRGSIVYHTFCAVCHGGMARGAGVVPDLRAISSATREIFHQIVLEGLYEGRGMAGYADVLTREDSDRILGYLMYRANADRAKAIMEAEPEEQAGP